MGCSLGDSLCNHCWCFLQGQGEQSWAVGIRVQGCKVFTTVVLDLECLLRLAERGQGRGGGSCIKEADSELLN